MKYFVTLISILLFSQMAISQKNTDSFEALWHQVKNLENDALTKSALKVVTTISEKAKKENNSPQQIKALLYSSKYALTLEENAQLNIVNSFKSEIEQANFPTKNVLESYLANLYWQYFQQNRYRFYNRTRTNIKVDTLDFRTWDLDTLFKEITLHFEASLENDTALKKLAVSELAPILIQEKDSEKYRPTVYDLLAHNALEFYSTSENNITQPANAFKIDNAQFLCDEYTFTQIDLNTNDSNSLQAKALCLYQQLIELHSSSKLPYAFAEIDIKRLLYVLQHATFENKEDIYLQTLLSAAHKEKENLTSSLYNYEVAKLLNNQGNGYQPKNATAFQWKKKEALEICEQVVKDFPKSRGAEKCEALKSQITAKSLALQAEKNIPINQPSRLLVNYKNYAALNLKICPITPKQKTKLNRLYAKEEKLAYINKLPLKKTWQIVLKDKKDYQPHATEIAMNALENGNYIIIAQPVDSSDKTFAYTTIQVTNLALADIQSDTYNDYQVIDRTNGKPLANANLKFSYRVNYNEKQLYKTFVSDKNGMVSIKKTKQIWNDVDITISHGKDTATYTKYYIYNRYNQRAAATSYSCFLFTDRSIYRPGQTLYFKGIALKRENTNATLLPQSKVSVQLKDVNGQVVKTTSFVTNDYGSFSGEFILPNTGLTGQFSMHVTSKEYNLIGSTHFSVEEYKRPKFETSFNPILESYQVNDSVTVNGFAKAFSGSFITNAKVVYRVKRSVKYPRWYRWSSHYLRVQPQEIAHGETQTDGTGNYAITFKALADTTSDKKNLPTFTYEITADVTDINGETHSTTTFVTIGYHTMTATMVLDKQLNKNQKDHKLTLETKNLNGQFVAAKGTVKMYKLTPPKYVVRPRQWAAPDYEGFTKSAFKKLFPHDAYDNEDDSANWEKGNLVWQSSFDTNTSKEITLKNIKKWESGKYSIELVTQDKFGQEVKDVLETSLFSTADKKLADYQLFEIKTDKTSYTAGDNAKITLLSNAENITVTVTIEKKKKVVETKIISLNKNAKSFTVPVTKDDLGGFAISYSYAVYNHFHSGVLNMQVPYPNTDLQIETITFRDKIQPGTDETWAFKIKGPKGDKVAAELLASMYDASLDAFRPHTWAFNPLLKPTYYSDRHTSASNCFSINNFQTYQDNQITSFKNLNFDTLNWFGLGFGYGRVRLPLYKGANARLMKRETQLASPPAAMEMDNIEELQEVALESELTPNDEFKTDKKEKPKKESGTITIRKNLQENAFFFPQLQTDKEGAVSFSFTSPEALTKWNLQLLAHTKNLESSYQSLQTVTQKELMVTPNAPRFLREGDLISISSKIANLTNKNLSGISKLTLVDALTGKDVSKDILVTSLHGDDKSKNTKQNSAISFKIDSLSNTQVSWNLLIPAHIQAIQYTVTAKAGEFSDGEQNFLPVLTNRMLVTETLPMWVRSNQTKTFSLDKLKTTTSTTLKHHKLTLEMTSNPAWYAVQALPYLMEYPYECNEQTFSKYYANTLATHIANSNASIQRVFDQWANSDALVSNLEKNQELKSLLIQETPWLRDAQSESEQKKRIALLFNLNKMKSEQTRALNKLKQAQKTSGAWAWFNGGPDNRFVTQHIIAGVGHLEKLTSATLSNPSATLSNPSATQSDQNKMIQNAVRYLDNEFVKEYQQMKRYTKNINEDHLSQTQIHYLYMRSFFKTIKASKKVSDIQNYYKKQAQKYWKNKSLYAQGMLALIMHRNDDVTTSKKILRALEENSITSEELGMYWKKNTNSWHWYQAPIETQALLIEAFSEVQPGDIKTIDNLKIWLLKNKQTNQWKTTKATTEAVYALLLQGSDWLSVTDAVTVLVGGEKIATSKLENVKVEAGTGYYKTTWNTTEIQPKMANVSITKKGNGIAWGALYWQYFEDLDKISAAKTPLQLRKKLFLKKNTDTGEEILEITPKTKLKVGDLVRIRIELRADRPMQFVHMKDMRAAGFEPINVLSSYKWQDGLGYYEATKDASTNFFFDYLPKGVFVFEYDVRVNNAGDFSNGITTIQSMYAPEFSSHSEGVRVKVN